MRRSLHMKQKQIDKRMFKKNAEELEQYMLFKKRGSIVESKKGKGSFKRKPKYPHRNED
jgi:stalled ribosome alternative rescue factor ArfA